MRRARFVVMGMLLALGAPGARGGVPGDDPVARGREVALAVDAAYSGYRTEIGIVELEIGEPGGRSVTRQMELRTAEAAGGGERTLLTFTAPGDVKGTKLLSWTHPRDEDDQWLYLPAVKRVKRITGANRSGSFMGSEFSYEDVSNPSVEKFDYALLDESVRDGRAVWVYERRPHDERSGYGRQVLWVAKDTMHPIRVEHYNRRNELQKVAVYEAFRREGRHHRPTIIRMTNVQTGKSSVLRWTTLRLGEPVSERDMRPDTFGN